MANFTYEIARLVEIVLDKLRVNVILVAFLVTWVIVSFGDKLLRILKNEEVEPQLIITVLVGLISVGVGGLIAAMIRMFESPQVPADLHERVIRQLTDELDKAKKRNI